MELAQISNQLTGFPPRASLLPILCLGIRWVISKSSVFLGHPANARLTSWMACHPCWLPVVVWVAENCSRCWVWGRDAFICWGWWVNPGYSRLGILEVPVDSRVLRVPVFRCPSFFCENKLIQKLHCSRCNQDKIGFVSQKRASPSWDFSVFPLAAMRFFV